jgi:hypothetical protein
MWLFTKHGFYSAVCGRIEGKTDREKVVVRARLKRHLVNLCLAFPDSLPKPAAIHSSEETDYRYRIVLDQVAWRKVVEELVNDMDYTNFKNACPEPEYHAWLNKVWGIGWDVQKQERTVTIKSTSR